MAKKIRFPLNLAEDKQARDLTELREFFSLPEVLGYIADGKLVTWLTDRYETDLAEAISALDTTDPEFEKKVCEVLGVEYEDNGTTLEDAKIRNEKLAKLKEFTDEKHILDAVDCVAFNQEDVSYLLNQNCNNIYLCGEGFSITMNVENVTYIGVNQPTVMISSDDVAYFQQHNIKFNNVLFPEDVKSVLKHKEEQRKYEELHRTQNEERKMEQQRKEEQRKYDQLHRTQNEERKMEQQRKEEQRKYDELHRTQNEERKMEQQRKEEQRKYEELHRTQNEERKMEQQRKEEQRKYEELHRTQNEERKKVQQRKEEQRKYEELHRTQNEERKLEQQRKEEQRKKENFVVSHGALIEYKGSSTSVVIPDTVTIIKANAFHGCHSVTKVTIPSSVKTIESGAFTNCKSLHQVIIQGGGTYVQGNAFPSHVHVNDASYGGNTQPVAKLKSWNAGKKETFSVSFGALMKYEGSSSSVVIPDTVTIIKANAFHGCHSVTKVTIPSSVKTIESGAFTNCKSLHQVIIQGGGTYVQGNAFPSRVHIK